MNKDRIYSAQNRRQLVSKFKVYLFTYGIILLTAFSSLYWRQASHILLQEGISKKYLIANVLQGFSVTSIPIILLLLGYFMTKVKKIGIFQVWGFLFIGTWICLLVACFLQDSTWIGHFYNALLPFLRNTSPLFSGILLAILTNKVIADHLLNNRYAYYIFFLLTFGVPTVFGSDIFNYSGGTTAIYAWMVFTLGANLSDSKLTKKTWYLLTGISATLLAIMLVLMPLISEGAHGDLSTATRLTDAANLFTVSFSFCLVHLLLVLKLDEAQLFSLLGIVLFSASAVLIEALNTVNEKSTLSIRYMELFEAISVPLIIWIIVHVYIKSKFFQKLGTLDRKLDSWHLADLEKNIKLTWGHLKRSLHEHRLALIVSGVMLILAYISMFMTNVGGRVADTIEGDKSYNALTYAILQRPQIIVINALLFIGLYLFLRGLTNSFWFSFLVSDYLIIIWCIATYLKIASRREPILPSEVVMLEAYGNLLNMVPHWLLLLGVVTLIILLCVVFLLSWKVKVKKLSLKTRVKYLLIPAVVVCSSFFWNHDNFILKKPMRMLGIDPTFYNQLNGAQINGPTLQFLNNLDVIIMQRPEDYSKAKVEEIVAKYRNKAAEINKTRTNDLSKQTIIFNLSESFSDPNHVKDTKLKGDPIPYIHQLMNETTSGYMISSGFGGGTANIEYMTMTGLPLANFSPTLSTPYTQLVSARNYNPSIVNYFSNAVAIHPYVGNFYSRPKVYEKFGFNDFIYLGSKTEIKHQEKIQNNPYLSDKVAYANALDVINENKDNGQFINLVTMQNHMPYNKDYYSDNTDFAVEQAVELDDEIREQINNFATGIHYTDGYVADFIEQLEAIDKPITLVFYGDHLPGIYANDMAKDGLNLHETDYFIYSNKVAREQGAKTDLVKSRYISPNDFPAMVSEATNSKISPYYALLTSVYQTLPAFYIGSESNSTSVRNVEYVTEAEKLVSEKNLTEEQKEILNDLRVIQYDITAGKNYVKDTDFMKIQSSYGDE